MTYNFNGKNLKIPDETIAKAMKNLEISQEEAIEMWLEDEGYLTNEEQEQLEKTAKANRITATIHEAKGEKSTKKRNPPKKEDTVKEEIITKLAGFLESYFEQVQITNKTKLITFELGEDTYEVNLIRKRKPKK